jgi:hypothetical protein
VYVIFRIFKQKILGIFGIHPDEPAVEPSVASGPHSDKNNLRRPV